MTKVYAIFKKEEYAATTEHVFWGVVADEEDAIRQCDRLQRFAPPYEDGVYQVAEVELGREYDVHKMDFIYPRDDA